MIIHKKLSTMRLERHFNINGKPLNIEKPIPRNMKIQKVCSPNVEMKRQKSCGPQWGKFVQQLLGVVNFA